MNPTIARKVVMAWLIPEEALDPCRSISRGKDRVEGDPNPRPRLHIKVVRVSPFPLGRTWSGYQISLLSSAGIVNIS